MRFESLRYEPGDLYGGNHRLLSSGCPCGSQLTTIDDRMYIFAAIATTPHSSALSRTYKRAIIATSRHSRQTWQRCVPPGFNKIKFGFENKNAIAHQWRRWTRTISSIYLLICSVLNLQKEF